MIASPGVPAARPFYAPPSEMNDLDQPIDKAWIGLARRSLLSLVSAVLIRLSGILVALITARLLPPTDFGMMSLLQVTQSTLTLFAGLNFGVVTTTVLPRIRLTDPLRAGRVIALSYASTGVCGLTMGIAVLLFRQALSRSLFHGQITTYLLALTALNIAVISVTFAQRGVLYGLSAFRLLLVGDLLACVLAIPLSAVLTLKRGLSGSIESFAAVSIASLLINAAIISRTAKTQNIEVRFLRCWHEWRLLPSTGLPTFLSGIVLTPVSFLMSVWLSRTQNGWIQIGAFSIADRWRMYLTFASASTSAAGLSTFSELARGGPSRASALRHVMRKYYTLVAVATAVPATIVVFVAPYVMGLYGPTYRGHASVLQFSAAAAVLTAVNTMGGQYLLAMGRYWTRFGSDALAALTLLLLGGVFISANGAAGLALATGLSCLAGIGGIGGSLLVHDRGPGIHKPHGTASIPKR